MTAIGADYMPLNRQLFDRSLAEALAALLGQRYPTAKHLARAVGIDPATAENLRKGHLSVTTFQKVLASEGRELWNKLGDELFGETFYQFEERRIEATIREAESVRSNLVRLRKTSEELLAGAGLLDAAPMGRASAEGGRGESRSWSPVDSEGCSGAEGQGTDTEVAARAHGGGE